MRFYFVSGMLNTYKDAQNSARYLSELGGGVAIRGVYNGSQGLLGDVGEYMLSSFGLKSKPSTLLAMDLISYFSSNPNAQVLLTCHSQGAMIVHETLSMLSKSIRDRCSVIAIAPGAYIDPRKCKEVTHYVAKWRDPVPWLGVAASPKTFFAALSNIKFVSSHREASFFDHTILSPTYNAHLRRELDNYMENGMN